jgi:4-amino-4-deoxy-L-arabinose transferase-like glycosyltransferase
MKSLSETKLEDNSGAPQVDSATTSRLQNKLLSASRSRRSFAYFAVIVMFWALIYVPGLFAPPLLDDADSIHAEAAREMLLRHDYVTLHANGIRYLDKAPLLYWLTAASYSQFGFTEFATRLPLTLFVLALLLACYALGSELAGNSAGLFAALILATAVGPYLYTRFLIPDIVVGLWLTVTVKFLWTGLQEEAPSLLLCAGLGVVTALDVLTKGLIGLVFPVGIIVLYVLATGKYRQLLRLRPVFTSAVFLAVAAPWHILAILRNPPQGESKGFFWFYFINEQINRYLNKRVPHDYNKVPFLLFWGLLLVWLLPWSPYVVAALRQVPARWREWRGRLTEERRAALLLAIWALVILGFFSFSTRQEYYVLPALPAFALLAGMWLAKEEKSSLDSSERRGGRVCARILLASGIVIFLIAGALAVTLPPLPPGTDFADALRKDANLYTLSMGHLFDLTPKALGAFRLPLALTSLGFFAGTTLNWWFRRRNQPARGNYALAGMMVFVLCAVHLALGIFYPVLGSKALADVVQREYQSGDVLVCDGEYANASSINFYTGIQLRILNGRINGLWYGSYFPDAPKIFDDDNSFQKLWRSPQRVFFLTSDAHGPERVRTMGVPYYQLLRSGEKGVYSNRPTATK